MFLRFFKANPGQRNKDLNKTTFEQGGMSGVTIRNHSNNTFTPKENQSDPEPVAVRQLSADEVLFFSFVFLIWDTSLGGLVGKSKLSILT